VKIFLNFIALHFQASGNTATFIFGESLFFPSDTYVTIKKESNTTNYNFPLFSLEYCGQNLP